MARWQTVLLFIAAVGYLLVVAGFGRYRVLIVNTMERPVAVEVVVSDGSGNRSFDLKPHGLATFNVSPARDSHLEITVVDGSEVHTTKVGYFEPRSTGMDCYQVRSDGLVASCRDDRH